MFKMADSNDNIPDETAVKRCSLCFENSDRKIAVKLCVDCKSYLCDECVKHHSKFPLFKLHKVLDDLAKDPGEIAAQAEKCVFDYCTTHQGQVIESYCKDHDDICCMVCVTITHRLCGNVIALEEAAKAIREKNERDKTKELLQTSIASLKLEMEKRRNNISQLDNQKLTILNEIDSFQENIIKKIAMVTEASREEVRMKHSELVNAVKKDVELLANMTSIAEESLNTIDNDTCLCDAKVFTNIKKSEKVAEDVEILVNDLPLKWPIRQLEYCIDFESPHDDKAFKTFGHFEETENKPYSILSLSGRYKGVFDVKLESDEKHCVVSGICVFENGMYGISDCSNRNFKRFNKNFEFHDSIELDGKPTSACVSGPQQAAIALPDEKMIQFLTCSDTLSIDSSFYTKSECYGVFFNSENNDVFVCADSSVFVYDKNGTLLKTIKNDETGESLFTYVKNCVFMSDSEIVYSTDIRNGLIASNKDGKKMWAFNNSKLEKPWGICLISCQHLLVASSTSPNILHISKDGNLISEILTEENGMTKLYTLAYDRRHSTVMLGGICNEIRIYRLCRK